MLALSLKQPWAQLVVHRQKRFETRSWKANVRGWVIVHASGSTVDAAGKAVMRSPVYAGFAAYTGVTVDQVTCGPHGTMPTHVIVGAMRQSLLECRPGGIISSRVVMGPSYIGPNTLGRRYGVGDKIRIGLGDSFEI